MFGAVACKNKELDAECPIPRNPKRLWECHFFRGGPTGRVHLEAVTRVMFFPGTNRKVQLQQREGWARPGRRWSQPTTGGPGHTDR